MRDLQELLKCKLFDESRHIQVYDEVDRSGGSDGEEEKNIDSYEDKEKDKEFSVAI
jgi:hypothetical protein